MRRNTVLISILLLPFITSNSNRAEILVKKRIKVETVTEVQPKKIKKLDIENNLIPAMIQVESLGNDSAIGDTHLVGNEAVGALQIRPIMIREVNRILKIQKLEKRFTRSLLCSSHDFTNFFHKIG